MNTTTNKIRELRARERRSLARSGRESDGGLRGPNRSRSGEPESEFGRAVERSARTQRNWAIEPPQGEAVLPPDFGRRLEALKERSGLSWEALAAAVGVDSRQVLRWRRGSSPSGGAMLSLVRLAAHLPGGLALLLNEHLGDPRPKRRAGW